MEVVQIQLLPQVKLYEGTNVIEIHTTELDSDGGTRVQGIEGENLVANNVIDGSNIEWYSVDDPSYY